jgi:uncharacterized membrane protein
MDSINNKSLIILGALLLLISLFFSTTSYFLYLIIFITGTILILLGIARSFYKRLQHTQKNTQPETRYSYPFIAIGFILLLIFAISLPSFKPTGSKPWFLYALGILGIGHIISGIVKSLIQCIHKKRGNDTNNK